VLNSLQVLLSISTCAATEWLGESIRQVDSSLIDEWEAMKDPLAVAVAAQGGGGAAAEAAAAAALAPAGGFTSGRAFKVMVRNTVFRWVQLLAAGR